VVICTRQRYRLSWPRSTPDSSASRKSSPPGPTSAVTPITGDLTARSPKSLLLGARLFGQGEEIVKVHGGVEEMAGEERAGGEKDEAEDQADD